MPPRRIVRFCEGLRTPARDDGATHSGGRRPQTSKGGNRGRCGEMVRQTLWDLTAVVPECEYNVCDMARTLRIGENTFRRPLISKSYALQKGHILQLARYVPDGSFCAASAEQIFPGD